MKKLKQTLELADVLESVSDAKKIEKQRVSIEMDKTLREMAPAANEKLFTSGGQGLVIPLDRRASAVQHVQVQARTTEVARIRHITELRSRLVEERWFWYVITTLK